MQELGIQAVKETMISAVRTDILGEENNKSMYFFSRRVISEGDTYFWFWATPHSFRILVPQAGMKLWPLAVKAPSPNHLAARKFHLQIIKIR